MYNSCTSASPTQGTDSVAAPPPTTSPSSTSLNEIQLANVEALRVRYTVGSDAALEQAVHEGRVVIGRLHVFKSWGSGLCFVRNVRLPRDIVLNRMELRGSALHDDVVAVELAHPSMWQVNQSAHDDNASLASTAMESVAAAETDTTHEETCDNDESSANVEDSSDPRDERESHDDEAAAMLQKERELAGRGRLPDGRRMQRHLRRETAEQGMTYATEEVRLLQQMGAPRSYAWPHGHVPVGRVVRVLHREMKLQHVAHLTLDSLTSADRNGSNANSYYRLHPYNPLLPQLVLHRRYVPHFYEGRLAGNLFMVRLLTDHDYIPGVPTNTQSRTLGAAASQTQSPQSPHTTTTAAASATAAANQPWQQAGHEETVSAATNVSHKHASPKVPPGTIVPHTTAANTNNVWPLTFHNDMLRCVIVHAMGRAESTETNNMAISAAYDIANDAFPDDVEACVPDHVEIPSPAVMRAIHRRLARYHCRDGNGEAATKASLLDTDQNQTAHTAKGNERVGHTCGDDEVDEESRHGPGSSSSHDDDKAARYTDPHSAATSCGCTASTAPEEAIRTSENNGSGTAVHTDTTRVHHTRTRPNETPSPLIRSAEEEAVDEPEEDEADEDGIAVTPEMMARWGQRRDLRTEEFVCTIDPATARDLDDALSIRRVHGTGGYHVGVHIADVSYFVAPDTALDAEARRRATSVYFVDKVVPMLPRRLSEHICSLNPGEDKLAFSALFELDRDGEVTSEWFGQTIIRSACRLSYEQAQSILEDKEVELLALTTPAESTDAAQRRACRVRQSVKLLHELAAKRRARSLTRGRLTLNNRRLTFHFAEKDSKLAPCGFHLSHSIDANWVVEELMLLANMRVAEKVVQFLPDEALLRTHAVPKPDKMAEVKKALRDFGFAFTGSTAKELQALIHRYRDHPHAAALAEVIKLTLPSARYTTNTSPDTMAEAEGAAQGGGGVTAEGWRGGKGGRVIRSRRVCLAHTAAPTPRPCRIFFPDSTSPCRSRRDTLRWG